MKPDDSSVAERYRNADYAADHPDFHAEDSPWKVAQIRRLMETGGLRPATVADVGCGAGEILRLLSRAPGCEDATFFGFEPSPEGFALCRGKAGDRLHFSQESIFEAAGAPFDLVLCIDVFEHVEDYLGFLRRLREVGRDFVFHIPLDMNVQMVLRGEPILRVRRDVGHLHYFSRETALATLRDCGFRVRRSFLTRSGIDRPKTVRARLLQWPRRLLGAISESGTARLLGGYSLAVHADRGPDDGGDSAPK